MGRILVSINDVVDLDNAGLPSEILSCGHEVLVVMEEGCIAADKIAARFPGLKTEIVSDGGQDLSLLRGLAPDVVLASMVQTNLLNAIVAYCERAGIPTIMLQDRPGWRLHLWAGLQPTALCVVNDAAVSCVEAHWKGTATVTHVTGMPFFDVLFRDSYGVNSADLRERIGVPEGAKIIHLACDKAGAPKQIRTWMRACEGLIRQGVYVYPSIHPAASKEDKKTFDSVCDGRPNIVRADLNPVERMLVSDVTIASIVSGMLDQASALRRVPIGFAGDAECEQLLGYFGSADPKEHPFVKSGAVLLAQTSEDIVEHLESGELNLSPLPAPDGRCAGRVAEAVEQYLL